MRIRATRFLMTTVATATALALAGCGSSTLTAQTNQSGGPPIVIGISLPLTGMFSSDGQAFKAGYELWQSVVNDSGGLLGRPVKLIILDDKSDVKQTKDDYTTLITADHVDLTFGPFSSLLTQPAEQAVAPSGYAMIEGAGDAETVFKMPENWKYRNLFSPSLPVSGYMAGLISWIKQLPLSQRPKSAAYPTVQDPFATPAVDTAHYALSKLGIATYFSRPFKETASAYPAVARSIAKLAPDLVVLGATDVPAVAEFMTVFRQLGYSPKIFITTSGPDQGKAFTDAVGANADGMMVPGGWSGSFVNPLSNAMVEQYIARYGGTAAGVNADVAEAYSVGEVAADAINHTQGTDNAKIISYLHSGVTLQGVQGPVRFDALGRNLVAVASVYQWQGVSFNQVLPRAGAVSPPIYPKPKWGL